jgi:WD40 repeat protein
LTTDGHVELRSSVDGQLIRTLAEHADASTGSSVSISPDRETVYFNVQTGDVTNLASVPVAGGQVTPFGGSQCCLQHAAVSPDGRWLAFTGVPNRSDAGRDILLYDLQAHDGSSAIYDRRWTSSTLTDLDRGISGLAWAPDSHHLAFRLFTGSATDGAPRVLDIDSAQTTLLDSLPTINTAAAWSGYLGATGNMLGVASPGQDAHVVALDPTTGVVSRALFAMPQAHDPVADPTGQHIVVLQGDDSDGTLYRWSDGDSDEEPTRISMNTGVIAAVWVPGVIATTPEPLPTSTLNAPSPTVRLPTTTTAPVPDFAGEKAAIERMIKDWGSRLGVDATVALVEDGEALRTTIAAVNASSQVQAARDPGTRIHSIELVGDDRAIVTFDILQGNNVTLGNQTGVAVKVDGSWRLSRDTYCRIALYVQVTCPAP